MLINEGYGAISPHRSLVTEYEIFLIISWTSPVCDGPSDLDLEREKGKIVCRPHKSDVTGLASRSNSDANCSGLGWGLIENASYLTVI
jgi:hypothetical protein